MGALERRITRIESQVQGDAIETFEELMAEARREQEAFERGVPYTPRRFSEDVVKVFTDILGDPEIDPEVAESIRGALEERGHL